MEEDEVPSETIRSEVKKTSMAESSNIYDEDFEEEPVESLRSNAQSPEETPLASRDKRGASFERKKYSLVPFAEPGERAAEHERLTKLEQLRLEEDNSSDTETNKSVEAPALVTHSLHS